LEAFINYHDELDLQSNKVFTSLQIPVLNGYHDVEDLMPESALKD
jgi:hypothetical protein